LTFSRVIEIAGAVGALNYNDLTLYELLTLYKGKRSEDWARTSAVLALVYNINARHAKSPCEFNPTIEREKPQAVETIFNLL